MAKTNEPALDEPEPVYDEDLTPVELIAEPEPNIEPVEAGAVEGTTVQPVEVNGFPIGVTTQSEHYSVETRLTPTGNPVVTLRRNGYVGDDYDIPAAYWDEFKSLLV